MDFQLPQGRTLNPSVHLEWLHLSISEFILVLRKNELFNLTKGNLFMRMTFHQKSDLDPIPPVQRLLDAVAAQGNLKRIRDELNGDDETGSKLTDLSFESTNNEINQAMRQRLNYSKV